MGLPEEEVEVFFKKILEKKLCICGEVLDDNKKYNYKREWKALYLKKNPDNRSDKRFI